MIKHETINNVLKVQVTKPFENFSVLIIPKNDGSTLRDFYLLCDYPEVSPNMIYMWGCNVEDETEAIDMACHSSIEYISS